MVISGITVLETHRESNRIWTPGKSSFVSTPIDDIPTNHQKRPRNTKLHLVSWLKPTNMSQNGNLMESSHNFRGEHEENICQTTNWSSSSSQGTVMGTSGAKCCTMSSKPRCSTTKLGNFFHPKTWGNFRWGWWFYPNPGFCCKSRWFPYVNMSYVPCSSKIIKLIGPLELLIINEIPTKIMFFLSPERPLNERPAWTPRYMYIYIHILIDGPPLLPFFCTQAIPRSEAEMISESWNMIRKDFWFLCPGCCETNLDKCEGFSSLKNLMTALKP